jgi:beta-ketoacyl synthase-like protein
MKPLAIEGVSLIGPGFADWAAARAVLTGQAPYAAAPTAVPAPALLPPNERRRSGLAVRIALAAGAAALAECGREAAGLATVFASSAADGDTCHAICEQLAGSDRLISPTRFHNSVHNAPAGYWSIATRSMAPSTSLSAYDASFCAGLLEAAALVEARGTAVLLVAFDAPYPEPLLAKRPLPAACGLGLVLAPAGAPAARAELRLALGQGAPSALADPALEALRRALPTARALPLLGLLARAERGSVALDFQEGLSLEAALTPCA